MSSRKPEKYLSFLERQRFDAIAESRTIRDAAQKLGIEEGTLNNWTMKLRKRLVKERGHLNACLAQQQRTDLLKKVLSVKKPLRRAEEDDTEEEE